MGSNVLLRRGLATSGGAAAVTTAGFFGEHTASRSTSRVACRAMNQRCHLLQQPRNFSSANTASKSAEATAIPPPAAAKSSSPSFVEWYEGHLHSRPILTKSITGSILWGIGDFVAQLVPQLAYENEGKEERLTYDWVRTGRAVTFGGLIHAPTSHLHFNFLEWMTVRAGVSGMAIPVFKTIMEQVRNRSAIYWLSMVLFILIAHQPCPSPAAFWTVCLLELDFELHVPWCHGCHARHDTDSNL